MGIGQPTVGGGIPADESYLVRRIEALETVVKQFMAARTLEAATIGAGGLTIENGGTLTVIDSSTGNIVLLVGQLIRDDMSVGYGFTSLRSDGTVVVQSDGDFFGVRDKASRIIVSDDGISGHGLANPHITGNTLQNTNVSTWMATNATTFTTVGTMYMEIQNPRLTWQINLLSDAGVTSQFLLLVNGTQCGTTQTVAPNTFSFWSTTESLPGGVSVGDVVEIDLQAKVSAATASARASCYRIAGYQS